MSSSLRWNWSTEGCAEWTDILKTFLQTFAFKTWKSSRKILMFLILGRNDQQNTFFSVKNMSNVGLWQSNSWDLLNCSPRYQTSLQSSCWIFTLRQMDKVDYKEANWIIWSHKTRLLENRNNGPGLAVLILMKNSPWHIRLLKYSRSKYVVVDLEQSLGGNMTKALNFISITFPEHTVNLFR